MDYGIILKHELHVQQFVANTRAKFQCYSFILQEMPLIFSGGGITSKFGHPQKRSVEQGSWNQWCKRTDLITVEHIRHLHDHQ